MRVFEDQLFHRFVDYDSNAEFADIEFRRCDFRGCLVSKTHQPSVRTTIRGISLIDCTENGCSIGTAIVEDVIVDTLRAPGLFQCFGAVFKHVVLRGKFDRLMFSSAVDLLGQNPNLQQAFDEANAEYYRHVDWALDISQGEFKELDLRGVPGHLIRRDPETQVRVTRRRALEGAWRELPFEEVVTSGCITLMLQQELPDLVIIAPKRHRKFKHRLHDLQLLRQAGVAEPD